MCQHFCFVRFSLRMAQPLLFTWVCPLVGVPPVIINFEIMFPYYKPSNELGVPPCMENPHINIFCWNIWEKIMGLSTVGYQS